MAGFSISNVFHSRSVPSGRARDPGETSERPNPASPSRWRADLHVGHEDGPAVRSEVRALAQLRGHARIGRVHLRREDLDVKRRPQGDERVARAAARMLAAHLGPHARPLLEAPDPFVEIARPEDDVIDMGGGRARLRRRGVGDGPAGEAHQGQEKVLHEPDDTMRGHEDPGRGPLRPGLGGDGVRRRAAPSPAAPDALARQHRVRLRGRDLDGAPRGRRRAPSGRRAGTQRLADLLAGRLARRLHRDLRRERRRLRRARERAASPAADLSSRPRRRRGLDAGRQEHPLPLRAQDVPRPASSSTPSPSPAGSRPSCRCPRATPRPTRRTASHLAYVPHFQWQPAWKHYRGGQTTPIWIADLRDSSVDEDPARRARTTADPMWVGDTVYFLSDRAGPRDPVRLRHEAARAVRQVIANDSGFDIKSASAGPGAIVYDQLRRLVLSSTSRPDSRSGWTSRIAADLPQLRPRFEKVEGPQILHAALSPTGKRVLVEARGEILTVPAEKGDVRNLTRTPGRPPTATRPGRRTASGSPASPTSPASTRCTCARPTAWGPCARSTSGQPPSFFYSPRWSPDSKKIAYADKRLNLWVVDLDKPVPEKIDTDLYDTPFHYLDPAWSPDSQWIAYTKQLHNYLRAVLRLLAGREEEPAGHRRPERRLLAALRPRRQVPLLHRLHQRRALAGLARHDEHGAAPSPAACTRPCCSADLPSPVAPESDEEGADDKGEGREGQGGGGEEGGRAEGREGGRTSPDEQGRTRRRPRTRSRRR